MYLSKFLLRSKRKLHKKAGFTFTELLAATIIMLLSTGLVVQCVDIAKKQYADRTMDSEAQLLVNSLSDAIQDYLQYASEIEPVASTAPQAVTSFHSDRVGKSGNFYINNSTGNTMVANGNNWNETRGQIVFIDSDGVSHDLISSTAYKSDSSPNGGMVAAMMMTYYETNGVAEFHPTVWIYAAEDKDDDARVLAEKSFVVGKAYDVYEDLKTYTVTFDSNGGSSVESKTVADGEYASRPNDPVWAGNGNYTFGGWYKTDCFDDEGKLKAEAEAFDFAHTAIRENITLKANWTEESNTYTVTFYLRNGEGNITETGSTGTEIDVPQNITPPNANYTFAGWYTDPASAKDTSKTAISPSLSVDAEKYTVGDSDVKFYARWIKKEVKESGIYNVKNDDQVKDRYNMTYDADTGYIYFSGYQVVNDIVEKKWNNAKDYDKAWYLKNTVSISRLNLSANPTTSNFTNSEYNAMKWKYNPTVKTFESTNSKKNKTYYIVYYYANDQNLWFVEKSTYESYKSNYPLPQFNLPDFDFSEIDAGLE